MRVLTRDQAKILDALLEVAGGDVALLEEAFERTRKPGGSPIEDLVEHILAPAAPEETPRVGASGICFSIDGDWWHEPGSCRYCRAPEETPGDDDCTCMYEGGVEAAARIRAETPGDRERLEEACPKCDIRDVNIETTTGLCRTCDMDIRGARPIIVNRWLPSLLYRYRLAARRCAEAGRERESVGNLMLLAVRERDWYQRRARTWKRAAKVNRACYGGEVDRADEAEAHVAELAGALRGFMREASQRVLPEDIGGPPEPPFIICNFCGESVTADLGVEIDHDLDCPIPPASRALSEPTGGKE